MQRTLRRLMPLTAVVAAVVVVTGLVVGYGARGTSAHEGETHPVHIHSGSCAALGDVVYPLNDLGAPMTDASGTPVASMQMGSTSAIPVDVSVTTVQTTLAAVADGNHAINAHESAENIGNYIACGDIGGEQMGSDLAIGLAELNNSGYSGVAWLHDNGDGTTTVTVFLTESGEKGAEAEASPAASPAASTGAVAVDIKDFAFNPPMLEIAAGTTVTWTNSDTAPHTATQDGGGFQSGRLDTGQSFSFSFDTPGTYEYHCEFHPNMHGTVVVK
jgi:plastocyanin